MKLGGRMDRHVADTIYKAGGPGLKKLADMVESGFIKPEHATKLVKLMQQGGKQLPLIRLPHDTWKVNPVKNPGYTKWISDIVHPHNKKYFSAVVEGIKEAPLFEEAGALAKLL